VLPNVLPIGLALQVDRAWTLPLRYRSPRIGTHLYVCICARGLPDSFVGVPGAGSTLAHPPLRSG
jgi:hypothetical protein